MVEGKGNFSVIQSSIKREMRKERKEPPSNMGTTRMLNVSAKAPKGTVL